MHFICFIAHYTKQLGGEKRSNITLMELLGIKFLISLFADGYILQMIFFCWKLYRKIYPRLIINRNSKLNLGMQSSNSVLLTLLYSQSHDYLKIGRRCLKLLLSLWLESHPGSKQHHFCTSYIKMRWHENHKIKHIWQPSFLEFDPSGDYFQHKYESTKAMIYYQV